MAPFSAFRAASKPGEDVALRYLEPFVVTHALVRELKGGGSDFDAGNRFCGNEAVILVVLSSPICRWVMASAATLLCRWASALSLMATAAA